MKLESLKLTNFRGFREFEITFDPQFTVLLGGNMAGKTAVLDGAVVALGALVAPITRRPLGYIDDGQVRRIVTDIGGIPDLQRQWPTVVEALASFRRGKGAWKRVRLENETTSMADNIPVGFLHEYSTTDALQDLPLIAHYGAQRMWHKHEDIEDRQEVGSRRDGYEGCLGIVSNHSRLAGWMRKQTLIELQRGSGYVQPQLAAVVAAVKRCIGSVERFWFDIQYEELRIENSDGNIQSFAMLSEGYRNTIAMVADIAWRAAVLNPQHGPQAHLFTDGVVLIDELDLHLHPAWQRRVVGDLLQTFPKIQFVVTTHSPQIVASVRRDQVRLLDRNQLVSGSPYVEGRDSSEILEDVFGVAARPEAAKAEIDALYRLIEDEDFVAARQHLAALEERLGPYDATMVRARWILDTEEAQSNRQPAAAP